jgi:hypothetical protein
MFENPLSFRTGGIGSNSLPLVNIKNGQAGALPSLINQEKPRLDEKEESTCCLSDKVRLCEQVLGGLDEKIHLAASSVLLNFPDFSLMRHSKLIAQASIEDPSQQWPD